MPIGLIGSETDLTYASHAAWHRAVGAERRCTTARMTSPRCCATAKQPMIIVGQGGAGASRRRRGAGGLLAPGGARSARWRPTGTASTCCTPRRRGSARWISASCRARTARASTHMLDGGVDVLWLLGADEFDTARIGADTFVVYQGHHGDAGARARRRDPARRGLHRKARHLRQHRRPGAARLPGGLSAGRGARGLDDPARVQRDRRPSAALRHDRGAARRGWNR